MKICFRCKEEKPFQEFNKHSQKKDGHYTYCKVCKAGDDKKHFIKNKDALAKYKKDWCNKNKEIVKEYQKKWKEKNLNYGKEYKKNNKHIINTINAKRRAHKLKAIPKWVDDEEMFLIKEAYKLAQDRTKLLGFIWHLDHIIPLINDKVCGLHTIANLQVIPAIVNLRKNNRYD